MSIVDFISVGSFGLTCFSIGYTFGKDSNKTQKLLFDEGNVQHSLLFSW